MISGENPITSLAHKLRKIKSAIKEWHLNNSDDDNCQIAQLVVDIQNLDICNTHQTPTENNLA